MKARKLKTLSSPIYVRFTPALRKELDKIARKLDRPLAYVLRQAAERYLEQEKEK